MYLVSTTHTLPPVSLVSKAIAEHPLYVRHVKLELNPRPGWHVALANGFPPDPVGLLTMSSSEYNQEVDVCRQFKLHLHLLNIWI
jgi:hypothetical protein